MRLRPENSLTSSNYNSISQLLFTLNWVIMGSIFSSTIDRNNDKAVLSETLKRRNKKKVKELRAREKRRDCAGRNLDQIRSDLKNIYESELMKLSEEPKSPKIEALIEEKKHLLNCVAQLSLNLEPLIKHSDVDLECPVCYNVMLPPTKIYSCSRGHSLCSECRDQMMNLPYHPKCPECRESFFQKRPRRSILAERLFQRLHDYVH